jgi:diadenosine tetraphosphate (Ap4A) HIT family hydrolase
MDCVFCNLDSRLFIAENELFCAIWDIHPVSKGHALIISKRHCQDFFSLSQAETCALQELSVTVQHLLKEKYQAEGYNLAMNCGKIAGQSIPHFHLHIIPRYKRDKVHPFKHLRESLC